MRSSASGNDGAGLPAIAAFEATAVGGGVAGCEAAASEAAAAAVEAALPGAVATGFVDASDGIAADNVPGFATSATPLDFLLKKPIYAL